MLFRSNHSHTYLHHSVVTHCALTNTPLRNTYYRHSITTPTQTLHKRHRHLGAQNHHRNAYESSLHHSAASTCSKEARKSNNGHIRPTLRAACLAANSHPADRILPIHPTPHLPSCLRPPLPLPKVTQGNLRYHALTPIISNPYQPRIPALSPHLIPSIPIAPSKAMD